MGERARRLRDHAESWLIETIDAPTRRLRSQHTQDCAWIVYSQRRGRLVASGVLGCRRVPSRSSRAGLMPPRFDAIFGARAAPAPG